MVKSSLFKKRPFFLSFRLLLAQGSHFIFTHGFATLQFYVSLLRFGDLASVYETISFGDIALRALVIQTESQLVSFRFQSVCVSNY